jgi:hypothetical protein
VHEMTALLKDEGGIGLPGVVLEAAAILPGLRIDRLPYKRISDVAPFDSVLVSWNWRPPVGGNWLLSVTADEPPAPRKWNDRDTLSVTVAHAPLSRVVGEAQPRPQSGNDEWFELWADPLASFSAAQVPAAWNRWSITVRSRSSPNSAGRSFQIGKVTGEVLLISSGESVRIPRDRRNHAPTASRIIWPGLRLADSGSVITLADPSGATVDSSVLRPVPDLPRGHSWQRWDRRLPGWSPLAWGVGTSSEDISPGWIVDDVLSGNDGENRRTGTDNGFRFEIVHTGGGKVSLRWESGAARLWLQADLYDTSGRLVSPVMNRVLVPGSSTFDWDPHVSERSVRPGIYIVVVHAGDADTGSSWAVKRALGVRP